MTLRTAGFLAPVWAGLGPVRLSWPVYPVTTLWYTERETELNRASIHLEYLGVKKPLPSSLSAVLLWPLGLQSEFLTDIAQRSSVLC